MDVFTLALGGKNFPQHPLIYISLCLYLAVLSVAVFPPSSALRVAAYPLIMSFWALYIATSRPLVPEFIRPTTIGHLTVLAMRLPDLLFISKVYFPGNVTGVEKDRRATPRKKRKGRLWWGWNNVLANPRGIKTPWQAKSVPAFSTSDPTWVPSRRIFLLTRSAILVATYLLADFAASREQTDALLHLNAKFFSRLSSVTREEVVTRAAIVAAFRVMMYVTQTMNHTIYALLCVSVGLNEPSDFPPLFGPMSEAYTLRRYWGYGHSTLFACT